MSNRALVPVNVYTATADPSFPTLRAGDLYYNTSTNILRVYTGSAWADTSSGAAAGSLTGTTLASNVVSSSLTSFGTSPTIATPTLTLSTTTSTTDGRIAWDATNDQLNIGDGTALRIISPDNKAATLTNKTISGASNTLTNIANASLTNSSITLNGTSVSLGGTATITASFDLTINAQTGTSYTLVAGDTQKLVEMNNAAANTLFIPTDTVTYNVGAQVNVLQTGAGQTTIAALTPGTTTVNGTPGLKLRAQWSSCTLIKRAANNWVVIGDLSI